MNTYRADLHIHTILSPCGDLMMSPRNIIAEACRKGIDILGITDHNTLRQGHLIQQLAKEQGIFVLLGAEVTSKEEVHCLTYFPNEAAANTFQNYLDAHLPNIANDTAQFGYQVCVDTDENIIYEEQRLLISGIDQTIDQIEAVTHSLDGIFIPAHINKSRNSMLSQLGFLPPDLKVDALELSKHITLANFLDKHNYLKNNTFIKNSDAHFVNDIGTVFSEFHIEHRSFGEIKKALRNEEGRFVKIVEHTN